MAAYMLDLKLSCDDGACEKRAVVEVRNTFNEVRGRFCRGHGQRKLDELLRLEVGLVESTRAK